METTMQTLTIACPLDLMDEGNAFAIQINPEPGSAFTFVGPPDGAHGAAPDGTVVALSSAPVSEAWIAAALSLAAAPGMAAVLDLWMGDGPVPQARAGRIVAVLGMPPLEALTALGVARE